MELVLQYEAVALALVSVTLAVAGITPSHHDRFQSSAVVEAPRLTYLRADGERTGSGWSGDDKSS